MIPGRPQLLHTDAKEGGPPDAICVDRTRKRWRKFSDRVHPSIISTHQRTAGRRACGKWRAPAPRCDADGEHSAMTGTNSTRPAPHQETGCAGQNKVNAGCEVHSGGAPWAPDALLITAWAEEPRPRPLDTRTKNRVGTRCGKVRETPTLVLMRPNRVPGRRSIFPGSRPGPPKDLSRWYPEPLATAKPCVDENGGERRPGHLPGQR